MGRTGMILDPSTLKPAALDAILNGIPDDEWGAPDLRPAIKHASVADTRYLRALLGLPPSTPRPVVGDMVIGEAGGCVVARAYGISEGGSAGWLWRRFPAGTTEDAIGDLAPKRKRPAAAQPLPSAASLRAEAAELQSRIDALEDAARALDAVEAAQAQARERVAALRVGR